MEIIAVVRTFGERTEAECIRRVKDQVKTVHVIRVEPFAEAVRECFRIAIKSKAEWLLTVDADVLLHDGAVRALRKQAKQFDGWQIVGIVNDRLSGTDRPAGVRLYRVSELPEKLPHVSSDAIRPEGEITVKFSGWEKSHTVVGLHDFYQWPRDYYRKGAQHRRKHPKWSRIVEGWRQSGDPDLIAAADGWDGVTDGI